MEAQQIIRYIAESEKKTPVKLYVNTSGPVDFGSAKVFGSGGSFTVFGDWAELSPILEANAERITDLVIENETNYFKNKRNSIILFFALLLTPLFLFPQKPATALNCF